MYIWGKKVKNKKKLLKSVTTEKSHIFTVPCPTSSITCFHFKEKS